MNYDKIKFVYFSPTGTTKAVLSGIEAGLKSVEVDYLDLTPVAVESTEDFTADVPVVIGVPVYGGRVPLTAIDRIRRLKGAGTPVVLVAVYGNRHYEDALLEMKNIVSELGFVPFAAGAFIGEHSFSSDLSQIAVGRPDAEDLLAAQAFGERISDALDELDLSAGLLDLKVPGNFPYRRRGGVFSCAPGVKPDLCTLCGACVSVCPVGAIAIEDSVTTNPASCIVCCACIKNCLSGARVMENSRIIEVAATMSVKCAERRIPETFLRVASEEMHTEDKPT